MNEQQTLTSGLITAIIALCGVIVWLVKRQDRKDERNRKEWMQVVKDSTDIHSKNIEVLERVIKLLTNWRGH